jgi:1,4-alpha-glucan branching enzyme
LFAYMYAQPGKKLLFMGLEFGAWLEWNHDTGLDWSLLGSASHAGLRLLVGDLNQLYRSSAALHTSEYTSASFEWIDAHDGEKNIISFLRKGRTDDELIAVICNFSPMPRPNYRVGIPRAGFWSEVFNSNGRQYGGTGEGNFGGTEAVPIPLHGRSYSLTVDVPPLAAVFFRWDGAKEA